MKRVLLTEESVFADGGYQDEACSFSHGAETASWPFVRARHESANKRFKQFNFLSYLFRHRLSRHSECFFAVANITRVIIKMGNPSLMYTLVHILAKPRLYRKAAKYIKKFLHGQLIISFTVSEADISVWYSSVDCLLFYVFRVYSLIPGNTPFPTSPGKLCKRPIGRGRFMRRQIKRLQSHRDCSIFRHDF